MTSILVEAENAVRAGRVRLHIFKPSERSRWVVVGRHGEYLVLPEAGYCSCPDFFFRVMSGEKPTCYHLVAVKLAIERKQFKIVEMDDAEHDQLMERWLRGEASSEKGA
ncbi:MAG: SWIM zinc finger family protein [Nitrososphaerota archaeon]